MITGILFLILVFIGSLILIDAYPFHMNHEISTHKNEKAMGVYISAAVYGTISLICFITTGIIGGKQLLSRKSLPQRR